MKGSDNRQKWWLYFKGFFPLKTCFLYLSPWRSTVYLESCHSFCYQWTMINSPSTRASLSPSPFNPSSKMYLNSIIPLHSLIQALITSFLYQYKKPLPFSHLSTFRTIPPIEYLPFSSYYSLAQELLTLYWFWSNPDSFVELSRLAWER